MPGIAFQGGTVAFDELHDSPRFTANRQGRTATRRGRVLWQNLPALVDEAYPAAPTIFGQYPGISYLFADTLEMRPFFGDAQAPPDSYAYSGGVLNHGGQAKSEKAVVEITYSPLEFESGGGGSDPAGDFITKNTQVGCEFMTLRDTGMIWYNADGDTEKAIGDGLAPHIVIPTINHSVTLHRAATIPMAAIRTTIGTVCTGTFLGAAAYGLLHLGSQTRWNRDARGALSISVDHQFSERKFKSGGVSVDWRHWYDPVKGKFRQLRLADPPANGTMLYSTSTVTQFNALFAV